MRAPLLGLAICAVAAPLAGQTGQPRVNAEYLFRAGNATVTLSAGGAAFTDFQQDPARILAPVPTSEFTRRISAQTTATAAATVSVWLSPTAALQVGGSFTPTRFRVTNTGVPAIGGDTPEDTMRYARLDLWSVDARVALRPALSLGRVYPYAILGGGVVRYAVRGDATQVPTEARAQFASGSRTQGALVLGAGAMIPLQRKRLLLTFDLTDHLTRTPLSDRAQATTVEGDGTTLEVGLRGSDESGRIVLTSAVRLAVGLTIPLRLH